ncbi:hypothetical protein BLNAU_1001 [Blattamonas nauphoetae]|uniref:Uncharacterized protein n=1 Tax=Blattamonas nauphoetae TaxID=2049346 RepID=A0ABQ9YJJ0_9EUKA|nr:hypothetical protein BLNAU_1001 [Blattamonas nauphoetae]
MNHKIAPHLSRAQFLEGLSSTFQRYLGVTAFPKGSSHSFIVSWNRCILAACSVHAIPIEQMTDSKVEYQRREFFTRHFLDSIVFTISSIIPRSFFAHPHNKILSQSTFMIYEDLREPLLPSPSYFHLEFSKVLVGDLFTFSLHIAKKLPNIHDLESHSFGPSTLSSSSFPLLFSTPPKDLIETIEKLLPASQSLNTSKSSISKEDLYYSRMAHPKTQASIGEALNSSLETITEVADRRQKEEEEQKTRMEEIKRANEQKEKEEIEIALRLKEQQEKDEKEKADKLREQKEKEEQLKADQIMMAERLKTKKAKIEAFRKTTKDKALLILNTTPNQATHSFDFQTAPYSYDTRTLVSTLTEAAEAFEEEHGSLIATVQSECSMTQDSAGMFVQGKVLDHSLRFLMRDMNTFLFA